MQSVRGRALQGLVFLAAKDYSWYSKLKQQEILNNIL